MATETTTNIAMTKIIDNIALTPFRILFPKALLFNIFSTIISLNPYSHIEYRLTCAVYPFFNLHLCYSIRVYGVYDLSDAIPHIHVCKYFCNASFVSERRFLKHGKVLHHAVMHYIFHNLVYKIYLSAIQH